jgi:hypothetical protein
VITIRCFFSFQDCSRKVILIFTVLLGCIHCEVAPASVGEKFQVSGGAMPAIGGSGFYPGEGNLSG